MRNVTDTTRTAKAYAPSVPLSVYRELAAEMQANQETIAQLKTQNQQLVQQNQQLRQEIQKLFTSTLHLQKLAESIEVTPTVVPEFTPVQRVEFIIEPPAPPLEPSAPIFPPQPTPPPETLVTEQEEGRYRRPTPPEKMSDLNGVWLAVALFLIGVFAFGSTFAILRPILMKR